MPNLQKQPVSSVSLTLDRDFAGRQLLGSREEQQDSYAFSTIEGDEAGADRLLVIVADGMGGHVGGREASLAAVSGFVDAFFDALDVPAETSAVASQISDEDLPPANQCPSPRPVPAPSCPDGAAQTPAPVCAEVTPYLSRETSALKSALLAANLAVDKMISGDPETLGEAGTTLLAALVDRHSLRWISVGDSPLLLWRNDKLSRLNADHSMRAILAEKVAAREMRADDIATHPERNALISVLNGLEIPKIDDPAEPVPLLPGDVLIAASDGILTLTAAEISEELKKLRKAPAVDVVRRLIEMVANKASPKQDNTTIAIVRV